MSEPFWTDEKIADEVSNKSSFVDNLYSEGEARAVRVRDVFLLLQKMRDEYKEKWLEARDFWRANTDNLEDQVEVLDSFFGRVADE